MYILVVEDEPKVAAFLKQGLQEESWRVTTAGDGDEALSLLRNNDYDIVILDIMLPKRDGLSVLRSIRAEGNETPILLLTARDAIHDRVTGLKAGADDYLVKPFAFEELLARVDALLRRSKKPHTEKLIVADLELDVQRRRAKRAEQEIDLTATEFRLLEFLMRNRGRVLSREDIEEYIWGLNNDPDSNIVDVYINHIRKKVDRAFDRPLIHTVRGFGYKLEMAYDE